MSGEQMRVIRNGDVVTYVAPGVALPRERNAGPAAVEARRRWATALAAAERTMEKAEALRRRRAVFQRIADAGWLLGEQAFARRLEERAEEMYAAAEWGDVEFFRRLD